MSAYIVDKEHIVYLVQAAMSRAMNPHGGSFSWVWDCDRETGVYKRDTIACNDYAHAAEVGNMLWLENVKSVSARYPGESSGKLPGPIGGSFVIESADITHWPQIEPVQVLKACDCYAYQTCEHDEWKDSQAHAFIERLRSAAVHALPGYDAAEWGAPKKQKTMRAIA